METFRLLYFLIERLKNIWIRLRGPYKRPARSPDLNHPDFFYWGTWRKPVFKLKSLKNIDDLRQKILRASLSMPVDMV